ncbi:hypothetical protein B0H19DRAFT_1157754 [Mycena capillaripes]|nr:hypothetical protein B0H19DRAFT_1157754 [Mycena capillaripes]
MSSPKVIVFGGCGCGCGCGCGRGALALVAGGGAPAAAAGGALVALVLLVLALFAGGGVAGGALAVVGALVAVGAAAARPGIGSNGGMSSVPAFSRPGIGSKGGMLSSSSPSPGTGGGGWKCIPGTSIPKNSGPVHISKPPSSSINSPSTPSSIKGPPSPKAAPIPNAPSAPAPGPAPATGPANIGNGGRSNASPPGPSPALARDCLRPPYQMMPAGSRSKRQVGQVVCPGRANQGPRHAVWKTCAQGRAMMPSGGGGGASLFSVEAAGVESALVFVSVLVGGVESLVEAGSLEANSAPSPSRRRSQQIAHPLSPPTAPTSSGAGPLPALSALTRSRRRTRPSGTRSRPARMRAAFSGESLGGGGGWPKIKSPPVAASPRVRNVKSWAIGGGRFPPRLGPVVLGFGVGLGLGFGASGGMSFSGGGARWDGWRRSRSRSWSSCLRRRRLLEGMGSSAGIASSSSSTSVHELSPSSSTILCCATGWLLRSSSPSESFSESLELETDCSSGIESSES